MNLLQWFFSKASLIMVAAGFWANIVGQNFATTPMVDTAGQAYEDVRMGGSEIDAWSANVATYS